MATFVVNEGTTRRITGQLKDDEGNLIGSGNVSAFTMTQKGLDGTVINSRDSQNVLNTNNVTLDANGNWVFQVQPEDAIRLEHKPGIEIHKVTVEWEWSTSPVRKGNQVFYIGVRDLEEVT